MNRRLKVFDFGTTFEKAKEMVRKWWSERPGLKEFTENRVLSTEVKMLSMRVLLVLVTRVGVVMVASMLKEWIKSKSLVLGAEWVRRSIL